MEKDQHKTKVVFRKWKDGTIDAYFPELKEVDGLIVCYSHMGQHSAANYHSCIQRTKPAKPEEYADLKNELEQIGYNLDVRSKYIRPTNRGGLD